MRISDWSSDVCSSDLVVEIAGLEPRQHGHLRPAFHLEHADRIGLAEHVVDGGIVLRHGGEIELAPPMPADEGEALCHAGQPAHRQHVSLQHYQLVELDLVPFVAEGGLEGTSVLWGK